jgi:hypothetical protein
MNTFTLIISSLSLMFSFIALFAKKRSVDIPQVTTTASIIDSIPQVDLIGRVYGHLNPGKTDDPDGIPCPFATLLTVKEVREGKVRLETCSMYLNGDVVRGDRWRKVNDFPWSIEHYLCRISVEAPSVEQEESPRKPREVWFVKNIREVAMTAQSSQKPSHLI